MRIHDVVLASDFETTVNDDPSTQTETAVWSAASSVCFSSDEEVKIQTNISDYMKYIFSFKSNGVTIFFHNERFDGNFIVSWLLNNGYSFKRCKMPQRDLYVKEFTAIISSKNKWYTLTIKPRKNYIVEIRDSLKLLPFSLDRAAKAFKTRHQKLEMDYTGHKAGEEIPEEFLPYIKNDVLVLRELIEFMLQKGNTALTIGSNCLNQMKRYFQYSSIMEWDKVFPDLKQIKLDYEIYGSNNAYEYCRKSFKGGWCYLKEGYEGKRIYHGGKICGITVDKNSMYPSHMHSDSEDDFPYGEPNFYIGKIPQEIGEREHIWYIQRIRCRFNLKNNMLPTVQIKGDLRYRGTEWLKTSDVFYHGEYHKYIVQDGLPELCRAELTLTSTDLKLFFKHYDVQELEYLDGCWFKVTRGLWDEYIDFYNRQKMTAQGAEREEAKLFMNNAYGKLASSDDSSFLEPYLDDDGVVRFILHEEHERKTVYIPAASAITSYSRFDVITHAQENYKYFIYADTDSLHLIYDETHLYEIPLHPYLLNHWKIESYWSSAIFIRQKTYAEFTRKTDKGKVENPEWEIKCAGMTETGKKMFLSTHPITDFAYGLFLPKSKLKPKNIRGGQVLYPDDYTLRKQPKFNSKIR